MNLKVKVDKDIVTNIAGIAGAIALAFQPIMDGMQGDITLADINRLILAASVATLGWYSGKSQSGKKIPRKEAP